jgi:hypothetical protein
VAQTLTDQDVDDPSQVGSFGQRSLVETSRYKTLIGLRLPARGFAVQQTEAAIGVAVLNRMLVAGCPESDRRQPVTA